MIAALIVSMEIDNFDSGLLRCSDNFVSFIAIELKYFCAKQREITNKTLPQYALASSIVEKQQ